MAGVTLGMVWRGITTRSGISFCCLLTHGMVFLSSARPFALSCCPPLGSLTDTVEYGETKRTLPCTHSYHSTCVRAWLKRVSRCPQCNNATVKERQRGIRRARRDARDAAAMAAAALAASGVIAPTGGEVTEGAESGGPEGGAAASSSIDAAPEFVVVPLGDAAASSAAPADARQTAACGRADSTGGSVSPVPSPQMPVEV